MTKVFQSYDPLIWAKEVLGRKTNFQKLWWLEAPSVQKSIHLLAHIAQDKSSFLCAVDKFFDGIATNQKIIVAEVNYIRVLEEKKRREQAGEWGK